MMSVLSTEGCLYQQDVVDYLVKQHNEQHLKENADGNQALSTKVINKFRVDSGESVV
nr:ATP-dependent RNA helicase HrpA [Escherichia coli]